MSLQTIQKTFSELIDRGALFHGYLFFGAPTLQLGEALASYLELKEWGSPSEPLMDMAVAGSGIDDIREAIQFLWRRPFRSPRKTLIIPNADALTREAQNAILKTAEEPPPHGLLLLLARHPDTLLPTLQSRLQRVYVHEKKASFTTALSGEVVDQFIMTNVKGRKELLKEIVEDSQKTREFVTLMMDYLCRDTAKNWRALKALSHRWTLINQLNTNKRLQLEAALLSL